MMSPCLSKTSNSKLSAITFFAKTHKGDLCGTNGLPLTPNSIALLGKSQFLKKLSHSNLFEYLDIIRGKHGKLNHFKFVSLIFNYFLFIVERTIIISELFGTPLNEFRNEITETIILRIFYQTADGLNYIQKNGFVCHNLEPANLFLDEKNNIKIFNYGLFYMTNSGQYVSFPIGNVKYLSPERLLGGKENIKSDVWSLGIIITELVFQTVLWPSLKISQIMRKILSLCNTKNVLEKIAREHDCYEKYNSINPLIRQLIENCLEICVKERFTPQQILESEIFQNSIEEFTFTELEKPESLLLQCPLKQIYYWWQLAGGDVHTELKKEGLVKNEAPILSMPKLVLLNGKTIGPPKSQTFLYDNRIVMLNLSNLTERLSGIEKRAFFPIVHSPKFAICYGTSMESLPLVIRERDTEYQFHRVILFTRLLKGYPFTRDLIIKEAQKDIPPLLRGRIWACLLGVIEDGNYDKIDKVTPTTTDRQIEVDIPRCHQYDELLSSPDGHRKLKLLLKAWVTSHPQYVYWQGLDSLTAPFLYLNFNDEERAFLSLYKFIPKYLHWFFLKDNSAIIKEYLLKFSQLTVFHEPILAKHLSEINFIPELFAIPWFLTMFSRKFFFFI